MVCSGEAFDELCPGKLPGIRSRGMDSALSKPVIVAGLEFSGEGSLFREVGMKGRGHQREAAETVPVAG